MLLAAGCGGGGSSSDNTAATTVPWADESVAPYSPPSPQPVKHPTSAAPCRATQLRVTPGRTGAATGAASQELIFINTSKATCLLSGSPKLSAVRNGTRATLLATPHDDFFGILDPTDLKPGGFSLLRIHTGTGCNKPVEKLTGLQVVLPSGGTLDARNITLGDQCGLAVSDFGLPRRTKKTVVKPGSPAVLEATLDLPKSVQSATTLAYTVTLTNPTESAVKLAPCPGYTQGVFAQGYALSLSYRLNCGTVSTIAPNGKVTYDMKLDLPQTKEGVDAKVAWGLNMPVGPYAAGTVRVNAG